MAEWEEGGMAIVGRIPSFDSARTRRARLIAFLLIFCSVAFKHKHETNKNGAARPRKPYRLRTREAAGIEISAGSPSAADRFPECAHLP